MSKITFAALGECIVDNYVVQKKAYLGGTATNCAFAANKAEAESYIISAVGTDDVGKTFYQEFENAGIHTDYLQTLPGKTSTLDVTLHSVTDPQYSNWKLGVLENFRLDDKTKSFLTTCQIAKGILFWPMKNLFAQFSSLSLPNTIKVGDFSGVSQYTEGVEALVTYGKGFDVIVKSLDESDDDLKNLLQQISIQQKKLVLGLLGDKGSIVFENGKVFQSSALATNVVDTNGAGDVYIGTFCVEYARSKNILLAMQKATKAASENIQHWGGMGIAFTG